MKFSKKMICGVLVLMSVGMIQAKWHPFKIIEKGAKEVGKGVKKGAEEVGKGAKKATDVVVHEASDVGKAVVKTTKVVVITVGGKTVGGTLVAVGGAIGGVVVAAGKGAGQLAVQVGAGAKSVVLDPGAALRQGGKLIINVGGQILVLPEEAIKTIAECGEAALLGSQVVATAALQKAADLMGGAIDKIFNLTEFSIKGSSDELIKKGMLPEATIKGKLLGKEISFDLVVNLSDPTGTVNGIFHQVVGLLPI